MANGDIHITRNHDTGEILVQRELVARQGTANFETGEMTQGNDEKMLIPVQGLLHNLKPPDGTLSGGVYLQGSDDDAEDETR